MQPFMKATMIISTTTSLLFTSKIRLITQVFQISLSLVVLFKLCPFKDTIQPIQLGTDVVTTGETLRVSGWGRTSDSAPGISQTLNYVDLTSISNSECEGVYGPWTIISSTLCCRGNPSESTCNVSVI